MALHAWKLAFKHPLTGERMSFESEPGAALQLETTVAPTATY